ncbi:unnamed protein product [Urochloa humidicola]
MAEAAAFRRLGTAVDRNFEGAAAGMLPPPRHQHLLAPNGTSSPPPSRRDREEAAPAPAANGIRPITNIKPPRGKKVSSTGGGKQLRKRAVPLWKRAALCVSIALNVVGLFLYLYLYVIGGAPPHHGEEEQQACLMDLELDATGSSRRSAREEEPLPKAWAAGAPSTGKPAVTASSVINLDHGDPTMFEEFWRGTGSAAEIVIPGWQTMSYFSDVGNVCWFLEPGFDHEVRRLHHLVGNAAVDGYHVLVGTGSTQLSTRSRRPPPPVPSP